jgi:hypothetical protein
MRSRFHKNKVLCVNHVKNDTDYWGGDICTEELITTVSLERWICSKCSRKKFLRNISKKKKDNEVSYDEIA